MLAITAVPVALLIILALRHRSTARTITKTSARQVWAQASDTRYPRTPRRTIFGHRRGLK